MLVGWQYFLEGEWKRRMFNQKKEENSGRNIEHQNKHNLNIIKREILHYSSIKVPGLNIRLDNEDLLERIEETVEDEELFQIVNMLTLAKLRGSNLMPIFQTIALGVLTKKSQSNLPN